MENNNSEASLQNNVPYAPMGIASVDFPTTVHGHEECTTEPPISVYMASQTSVMVVVEGTLDEVVLNPTPISAIPQGFVENQPQNIQQSEKNRSTLVSTTEIEFERITSSGDPVNYKFKAREVVTPSATENIGQVDNILKGWKLECRMRANKKTIDKFYIHSSSTKIFRSLVEVTSFVDQTLCPAQNSTVRLEGPSQPSIDRKRKRVREEKYNNVEEFMTKTYKNLLNSSFPVSAIEPLQKEFVEKFLREAFERLTEGEEQNIEIQPFLGNSEREINELVDELLAAPVFID